MTGVVACLSGPAETTGVLLVLITLTLVAGQLAVANQQARDTHRVAAVGATLDVVDRATNRCLTSYARVTGGERLGVPAGEWSVYPPDEERDYPESGSERIYRLQGEMIDHLRLGEWKEVDATYQDLRSALCMEVKAWLPEHVVDPRIWGEEASPNF